MGYSTPIDYLNCEELSAMMRFLEKYFKNSNDSVTTVKQPPNDSVTTAYVDSFEMLIESDPIIIELKNTLLKLYQFNTEPTVIHDGEIVRKEPKGAVEIRNAIRGRTRQLLKQNSTIGEPNE